MKNHLEMTPKEKAKQLFEKNFNVSDKLNKYPMRYDTTKACALICANELIEGMANQINQVDSLDTIY